MLEDQCSYPVVRLRGGTAASCVVHRPRLASVELSVDGVRVLGGRVALDDHRVELVTAVVVGEVGTTATCRSICQTIVLYWVRGGGGGLCMAQR